LPLARRAAAERGEWERAARGDNPEASWPWGAVERPKDFNHGQPRAEAMREIERTQQWLVPPRCWAIPTALTARC